MTQRSKSLSLRAVLVGLGATGTAALAAHFSAYGFALFTILPTLMGFFAALPVARAPESTWRRCLAWSLLPLPVAALLGVAIRIEGLICILMAIPIAVPLALLGGWFAWLARERTPSPLSTACVIALLPAGILLGPQGPGHQVFRVTTSIVVNAPAAIVWKRVIAFPALGEPENLLFRAGVAYPLATELDGPGGVGAARRCLLSTGTMTETVTAWEPRRLLRFDVNSTPAAMRELTPWPNFDPPHLHGFYESRQGEFQLTALPGNRTRVDGTSWYQHGLEPAQYWRLWSDYVVHQVHHRVLEHVKRLAEQDVRETERVMVVSR